MLAAAVVAGGARDASAQGGSGAERYEVTITPPKRPGSEPAAVAAPGDAASAPADAAAHAAPAAESGAAAAKGSDAARGDGHAGAAATATPTAAPAPRAAANAPMHTLQVGAFRQRKSATTLRDALAASFQDVSIVEVQSGGEPLFRVNVGNLPHGPALDELRRKVVAAGYAAFEVAAPTAPAAN